MKRRDRIIELAREIAAELVDDFRVRNQMSDLAAQIAEKIIDDYRTKRLIREVVLRTILEQERQRGLRTVQCFLASCDARGVRLRVDDEGVLRVSGLSKMGNDLKAVLTVYRREIVAFLTDQRDLARASNNGKDKR